MKRSQWMATVSMGSMLGLAGLAHADFPPNVVDSDSNRNTAMGSGAEAVNVTGTDNTAGGYDALDSITSGSHNTAFGSQALVASNEGYDNTAIGYAALLETTTGHENVAIGSEALRYTTTGQQNMAIGRSSLRNNVSGGFNAALGYASCWSCRSASQNSGFGTKALYSLQSGTGNIALGYSAGYNLTGSNNIDIGNSGMASESGIIRIGAASTQTATYIAGIATSKLSGSPVYVTSSGQLGVAPSSKRYKTDIQSLAEQSNKLDQLRPVSFHLKTEPNGALQFGLIAEEVDKVYPNLVIRDDAGEIQGVRYDELAPMLLREVQSEHRRNADQAAQIAALKQSEQASQARYAELANMVGELKKQNDALQAAVQRLADGERVAMR